MNTIHTYYITGLLKIERDNLLIRKSVSVPMVKGCRQADLSWSSEG